jgi:3-hydroxymyristoyl/3-hydroxydecanoyl-(acyl carrier protein) dehydratase
MHCCQIVKFEQVKRVLPHKWPFLLISDDVLIEDGKASTGRPFGFFWWLACKLGHFSKVPIIPGVVMVELCAQLCAVLIISQKQDLDKGLPIFKSLDAKFIEPLHPSKSIVCFEAKLSKEKLGVLFFECLVQDHKGKVLAEIKIAGRNVSADVFLDNNGSSTKPAAQH